jgi:ATP synthase protein I
MSEGEPTDPLARLGARIERARAGEDRPRSSHRGDGPGGSLGSGLRIGIEMLAALCVGVALGWVAVHYFGAPNWVFIVFFFLGSAAGIMNVYRAARRL